MLHGIFMAIALFSFAPTIPSKAPHIEVDHTEFTWFFDNRPKTDLVFKPKPVNFIKHGSPPEIIHRPTNRHH